MGDSVSIRRTYSEGAPCPLTGAGHVRMTENFLVSSRDRPELSGWKIQVDGAFADRYLALGAQPTLSGYMLLSCIDCKLCLPIRTILPEFNFHSEHRRVAERNADLRFSVHEHLPDFSLSGSAHVALYRRYALPRFHGGVNKNFDRTDAALDLMGQARFAGMSPAHIEARTPRGRLMGSLLFHMGEKAAYGTVFYYEPERRSTSLAQAMILKSIEYLRERGFDYLYLAQWSRIATAFSWKDGYRPLEVMIDGAWQRKETMGEMRALRVGGGPAYPARRNGLSPESC